MSNRRGGNRLIDSLIYFSEIQDYRKILQGEIHQRESLLCYQSLTAFLHEKPYQKHVIVEFGESQPKSKLFFFCLFHNFIRKGFQYITMSYD
jgi:hypothetical protein